MKKLLLLFVLLTICLPAYAANPTYLGEAPPSFVIGRFVNAIPVFSNLEEMKGEVVFVEFWRTSCPPCRAAMQHLEKVFNTYKRPDFHIVASTQDNFDLVKRFLYHHPQGAPVTYPFAVETKANWGVTGVPMGYIVGRDGKVVWAGNPNSPFEKQLDEALAAPAPDMPAVPKKFAKTLDMVATETYASALKDAIKAAENPETALFGEYITNIVKKYHDRYIMKVNAFVEEGDIYKAQTLLEDAVKKFAGTPYETAIKDRIKQMKEDKDSKESYKLYKELFEIGEASRTGKKASIDEAIIKLTKFIEKNGNHKVVDAANVLLGIMKNPWNEQEANR